MQGTYIIAPLMQTHFPDKIAPRKLANAGSRIEGEIPLQRMPRLASLLSGTEGRAKVILEAGIDEQDIRFLRGHIDTTVVLNCQRCLEPVQLTLDVDFQLGMIYSESQMSNLPADYAPLLVPKDEVSMSELVEDELILALPLVAMHEDRGQCEAMGFVWPGQDSSVEPADRVHPLAALSTLLTDSKHKE